MYDLKDLKIEEIAFVDKGAGKGVRVQLYKRRKEIQSMSVIEKRDLDEVLAGLSEEDVAVVLAAIDEAKNAEAEEAVEDVALQADDEEEKDKGFDRIVEGGNKGDESKTKPGRRDYEKASKASLIAKQFEQVQVEKRQLEQRIAKMELDKEREGFVKMAESFPNVPTFNAEQLGDFLMQVNKRLKPETAERVEKFIKSVNQICSASAVFSEAGLSGRGSDATTAWGQAEEIAKGFMKQDSSLTRAAALDKAWDSNPELRNQYRSERRGRN